MAAEGASFPTVNSAVTPPVPSSPLNNNEKGIEKTQPRTKMHAVLVYVSKVPRLHDNSLGAEKVKEERATSPAWPIDSWFFQV